MKHHRIKDRTDLDGLATFARMLRAQAGSDGTAPDLVAALEATAEMVERFCASTAQAVAQIEGAIAELNRAIDRSLLN
ncbi:MAG: hypothetical protein HZT41_10540 [Dechloromonas sp.]|nr:MAG: hypothetical protein HZT41_10540 [Dechloromonas sp.]